MDLDTLFVFEGLIDGNKNKKEVSIWKLATTCILFTILIVVYKNVMGKIFLHNSYAEFFYDNALTIAWLITIFELVINIKINKVFEILVQQVAPLTMGIYIIHPL